MTSAFVQAAREALRPSVCALVPPEERAADAGEGGGVVESGCKRVGAGSAARPDCLVVRSVPV